MISRTGLYLGPVAQYMGSEARTPHVDLSSSSCGMHYSHVSAIPTAYPGSHSVDYQYLYGSGPSGIHYPAPMPGYGRPEERRLEHANIRPFGLAPQTFSLYRSVEPPAPAHDETSVVASPVGLAHGAPPATAVRTLPQARQPLMADTTPETTSESVNGTCCGCTTLTGS